MPLSQSYGEHLQAKACKTCLITIRFPFPPTPTIMLPYKSPILYSQVSMTGISHQRYCNIHWSLCLELHSILHPVAAWWSSWTPNLTLLFPCSWFFYGSLQHSWHSHTLIYLSSLLMSPHTPHPPYTLDHFPSPGSSLIFHTCTSLTRDAFCLEWFFTYLIWQTPIHTSKLSSHVTTQMKPFTDTPTELIFFHLLLAWNCTISIPLSQAKVSSFISLS